jgi:hypothetical protein
MGIRKEEPSLHRVLVEIDASLTRQRLYSISASAGIRSVRRPSLARSRH